MMAFPTLPKGAVSSVPPAAVPRLLDLLGTLAVAAGALAAALLLARTPFDGPWRLVLAVAAAFAGLNAGFLMMGLAAELRAARLPGRRLLRTRLGKSS